MHRSSKALDQNCQHGLVYLAALLAAIVLVGIIFPVSRVDEELIIGFELDKDARRFQEAAPSGFWADFWAVMVALLLSVGVPMVYLLYFVEERLWLIVNSLLFLVMAGCLLLSPTISFMDIPGLDLLFVVSTFILLQVCWMAVILFSPVQQLTRRLGFVVLGVLMLIGLSEISKLNLHQYLQAPKVSDNSVRQSFTSTRPT
jgi:hypothetical protein